MLSNLPARGKPSWQSSDGSATAAEVPVAASGTVVQQQNERRQAGRTIWDEMLAQNKQILEQIGKTTEEIALILADLQPLTRKPKQGCDDWLETREHSRLIFDRLPPQMMKLLSPKRLLSQMIRTIQRKSATAAESATPFFDQEKANYRWTAIHWRSWWTSQLHRSSGKRCFAHLARIFPRR
jgi:hypothetical protein